MFAKISLLHTYCTYTACDENHYGENCEVPCSRQCKVQDGRDCDITSGVCLGGCIGTPGNGDWWVGDRCDLFVCKSDLNLEYSNLEVYIYLAQYDIYYISCHFIMNINDFICDNASIILYRIIKKQLYCLI